MKLKGSLLFKKVTINNALLFLLVIALIVVFGSLNSQFWQASNIVQYLNSGVVLAFLTFGLSITIITGNFDYSIGAMTGFGTVLMAMLMSNGVNLVFSLVLTLVLMLILGGFNGFIVGYLKIPGMLATLGTSSIIYGVSLVLTKGQAINAGNDSYLFFGKSNVGTIPFGLVFLLVVFIVSMVLMHKTKLGRRIYLVGASPKAAEFAGISNFKTIMIAHMFSATMCFCGALVLGSKMASGRADVADTYVLQAVTAAVFGGVSIKGGKGSLLGSLLGVAVFTLLTSGLTMINVSQYYRQVISGVLLLMILFIRNFNAIFSRQ